MSESIELITKYLPYVDEIFTTESKTAAITNRDFKWDGAHAIKVYKVSTSPMFDYGREGDPVTTGSFPSRYGEVAPLTATTETMTLRKDRSFTFEIDKLDMDETQNALSGATALARQLRNVVVPEIDTYTIAQIAANAGHVEYLGDSMLNQNTIYSYITDASKTLDLSEVPETGRVLLVTPEIWKFIKLAHIADIPANSTGTGSVIYGGKLGALDGMQILRLPASRMPANTGFIICHPCATTFAQKLASYQVHKDPPGINGSLVEGRIVYDAFVLENKKDAIYLFNTGSDPDSTQGE